MKLKNSFEEAYNLILAAIISGELKPGEVVTEASLAARYGISRTPVREALNRLQCESLIITSGRTKRIFSLSVNDISEIFELKELIEAQVARDAAAKITSGQIKELDRIVDGMRNLSGIAPVNEEQANDLLDQWLSLDRQFHDLLFRISGNNRARQIISRLNIQWHRMKVGLAAMQDRIGYAIPEHEEIANAVMAKQPEKAGMLMIEHLEKLRNYIIKLMNIFLLEKR